MQYTGAKILLETLLAQGVDVIFGYPGGTVLNIFDELYNYQDKIKVVLASHEQGAAHAADGYARSTGKTGVVLATSGPGATNLVTGIANAYLDSVPLVALTGNVATDLIGRDSFQEVDITGITNPIVKHNFIVQDAADMARVVQQAFSIANSGRKGPVLIDIPKNVTAQLAEFSGAERFEVRPFPESDEAVYREAAEAIRKAERPLIYAGGGITFSDASAELVAFANHLGAPVCVSMMGISSVAGEVPAYLGMVGMHGTPAANLAVKDCDLLLAIGARFSDRVAGNRKAFAPDATIIHVDVDRSEISKNVSAGIALCGNAADVMKRLMAALPPQSHPAWIQQLVQKRMQMGLPEGVGERLTPMQILRALHRVLGDDGIVATDVGQHQMWTAQHYPFRRPRTFISSCGLGAMGYGLGAAIGSQIGNPGKRVALITGDGSFHMNMNELAVAVSQNLPLMILVMNNQVLGMVHQWQTLFYHKRYSYTEINRQTDYVKLAEAFGAVGYRIEDHAQIADVLERAYAEKKPCVIDCRIDSAERVYPIIPPGGSQTDMIFTD